MQNRQYARTIPLMIALMLMCLPLLLAACGGSANNSNNSSSNNNEESRGAETSGSGNRSSTAEPAFPRTLQTANGELVIEKQPERIALVHWGLSDSLLTLNLSSVALALPFTYEQSSLHSDVYKPYVEQLEQLEIIGENTTVDMERLLAYDPDLIIAGTEINQEILDSLPRIAPTLVIDEAAMDVWNDWPGVIELFGEALGQEERARQFIDAYRNKVQDARAKLAGTEGTVAFVQVREKQVWLQGSNYTGHYYEPLGLKPPASADIAEGAQLTLEGLGALDPDHLFLGYFNYTDPSLPALTDEWELTAVWKNLQAVRSGQVYGINGELAFGFGPIGQSYGIDAIVEALQ